MVIPLVKAATQDWRFLEAPNQFIFKKKGHHLSARKRRYQNWLQNNCSGVLMPCCEQTGDG
ncbi:MAG: hypothetical protein GY935_09100 [Gammaproteobacteria bacterium]|nr:hypothetical protein [Gammaproteobacteria bacterium]